MDLQQLSALGAHMTNPDRDIRKVFTDIGCIMEDASVVAVIWEVGADASTKAKLLREAWTEIGGLLDQIEREFT